MDVLKGLAKAWETEQDSVVASSLQLHDAIHVELELEPSNSKLSPALLDSAVKISERNFDPQYGGFSKAPKFPHAMELAMLIRYYSRTGDEKVKHMVEFTLDNMARGGIFDQFGGGFHRYSTDDKWLIPHFEKMLYDNALLIPVYDDASGSLVRNDFNIIGWRCTKWMMNEMQTRSGAFASSLDADSDGEEGKYYVWTPDEIHAELGDHDTIRFFSDMFDITESGNFENGYSIPNRISSPPTYADHWELLSVRINQAYRLLNEARKKRTRPDRDDKELCDWNGLAITVLLRYGVVDSALNAANRFVAPYENSGELVHSFLGDKELRVQLLMDYAALGNGCLDLFQVTGDLRWFNTAYKLADDIERRFAKGDGLYYMSEDSVAGVRSVDLYDSALPSGNSLAGNLFIKLYYLTGEERFRERAEKQISTMLPLLEDYPTAFSQALLTAEWLMFPPDQVIIVYADATEILSSTYMTHNRIVLYVSDQFVRELAENHPLHALLQDKMLLNGKTTFYLCRNFTCDFPTNDARQVHDKLSKSWEKHPSRN